MDRFRVGLVSLLVLCLFLAPAATPWLLPGEISPASSEAILSISASAGGAPSATADAARHRLTDASNGLPKAAGIPDIDPSADDRGDSSYYQSDFRIAPPQQACRASLPIRAPPDSSQS